MKIQILSDLHLEFHADAGKSFMDSMNPSGVDVLVLAGDLTLADRLEPALRRLCEMYPQVVYITGNHEYYQSSPGKVHETLARIQKKLPNLHWLNNEQCEIDGVTFFGSTLWFPDKEGNDRHAKMLNDFSLIKGFVPWVYDTHAEARRNLAYALDDGVDVIVTHHIPSYAYVDREYKGSELNRFFVGDVDDVTREFPMLPMPTFWVYGHTHKASQRIDRGCKVICNPFGYPHENKTGFVEKLVVSI